MTFNPLPGATSDQGKALLLPCPFCGSAAEYNEWPDDGAIFRTVTCVSTDCNVSIEGWDAVALWNQRAPLSASEGAREKPAPSNLSVGHTDSRCTSNICYCGKWGRPATFTGSPPVATPLSERRVPSPDEGIKAAQIVFEMLTLGRDFVEYGDGAAARHRYEAARERVVALVALGLSVPPSPSSHE